MKNLIRSTYLILFLTVFQFSAVQAQKKQKMELIIFDTDMGNDIDDVLALDMLYKYADQGKIKLLGIMNNKGSAYSTRLIDMLSTWYGYGKVPIGKIENGVLIDDYADYSKNMVQLNDSTNLYKYSVKQHDQLLPAHELYRKILAKQADGSVTVVSVGFSTNLARLLQSGPDKYSKLDGKALVAKKVKVLSIMAGSFGDKKRAEFNVIHDIPAARYTIANWPGEIVLSPFEVGKQVIYPGASIQEDFQWATHHPLVDAYKRYRPFPYNRPTWDLTSVYYIGEKENSLLDKSKPGILSINEKGYTDFVENPQAKHYVLSIQNQHIEPLKTYFKELIREKPKAYRK
ncbi:nucleoside hydrolase [Sphingobacterium lactis]|uniref:nucleoside hydrolase n=1 Tax=Sphingobacterium lactis TaxID=797291 RepID=UPI003F7F4088